MPMSPSSEQRVVPSNAIIGVDMVPIALIIALILALVVR
jgi:hypothetical protein